MEEDDNNMYNNNIFNDDLFNDNISINMFLTNIFNSIGRQTLADLFSSTLEQQILEEVMEESLQEHSSLQRNNTIINIEKQKYKDLDDLKKENNKDCSICITDFKDEDDVSITKCKHIFHNSCIVEWGQYKQECPNCRNKIN
jgi:hypothetical protein